MSILILNVLANYLLTGVVLASTLNVIIYATRSSETMNGIEMLASILAWPIIAGTFISDLFN